MAKKRGRPRKVNPEDSTSSVAGGIATITDSGIYNPEYLGRKIWFLGIKVDPERNVMPFHNRGFGGVPFQQGTQRQTMVDDEGTWLTLDTHRTRVVRQHLYAEQVLRAVASIKQRLVRWQKGSQILARGKSVTRWSASVISLKHRIKTYNKKEEEFVPSGYRYYFESASDVPVAQYLVLVPRSFIDDPSAGKSTGIDIVGLPSMLDLDSSLIPDRMNQRDLAAEDEPW